MGDETDESDPGLDADGLAHLLVRQSGVVSRRQLVELKARPHEIRRMLRRKQLTPVHPGVYVEHNGPLTWEQRAWAAVQYFWPAALTRDSALAKPRKHGPIHLAVDAQRRVRRLPGVVVHRCAAFDQRVRWNLSPPRIAIEHAVIDQALTKSDVADMFQVLANACQSRATTAAKLADAVRTRTRVPNRQLLLDLLDDLAEGACSVLEREYLRLERLHGLPCADRQEAAVLGGQKAYRDVSYELFRFGVELDGRAFHDNAAARNNDFERDLDSIVDSEQLTVRLTYGQIFTRGCQTMRKIATLLERRGWPGPFRPCPNCRDNEES